MPSDSGIDVFACGSNLHVNRIRQRAPSAHPIGIGYVQGRKLEFRKRSVDGSAKADARLTSVPTDKVWGAVYRVSPHDKRLLDQYESLGIGYDEICVNVNISFNQSLDAFLYVARPEMIEDSIHPYSWYLDFVRYGALQHGLPFCYVNRELNVESVIDPDHDRQMSNRLILNG